MAAGYPDEFDFNAFQRDRFISVICDDAKRFPLQVLMFAIMGVSLSEKIASSE